MVAAKTEPKEIEIEIMKSKIRVLKKGCLKNILIFIMSPLI
jgi:hypothetical protein